MGISAAGTPGSGAVTDTVAALATAVDAVLSLPLPSLSDTELLEAIRAVERCRRRLEFSDQPNVAVLDSRAIPEGLVMRNAAGVLLGFLNLSPAEASRRVRHARHLGAPLSPSGQRLTPLCPATAVHRAAGLLTDEHVAVIVRALHKLPDALPVEQVTAAELFLADWATKVDARQLSSIARRLVDTLDPDGTDLRARSGPPRDPYRDRPWRWHAAHQRRTGCRVRCSCHRGPQLSAGAAAHRCRWPRRAHARPTAA